MLDIIAEFLIDAIGDLFESGAEAATDVALDAAVDVGVDTALDTGVDAAVDNGVDAVGGGASVVFDNHPISPTLRSAGFFGQV